MNKFKPGDKVRKINDTIQYSHDTIPSTVIEDGALITINQINFHDILNREMFTCIEYPKTMFAVYAFELAYIKEFSDKLEDILNEEN